MCFFSKRLFERLWFSAFDLNPIWTVIASLTTSTLDRVAVGIDTILWVLSHNKLTSKTRYSRFTCIQQSRQTCALFTLVWVQLSEISHYKLRQMKLALCFLCQQPLIIPSPLRFVCLRVVALSKIVSLALSLIDGYNLIVWCWQNRAGEKV